MGQLRYAFMGHGCRILEELASTHSRRSYGGKIHTRCRYSLFIPDVSLTLCVQYSAA